MSVQVNWSHGLDPAHWASFLAGQITHLQQQGGSLLA